MSSECPVRGVKLGLWPLREGEKLERASLDRGRQSRAEVP